MEGKEKTEKAMPDNNEIMSRLMMITKENSDIKNRLKEAYSVIDSLQTQNLFSYISYCMKIMDHPEMYTESFVDLMSKDTEILMTNLHNVMIGSLKNNENGSESDTDTEEA